MKLVVLSDVHANLAALQAVLDSIDALSPDVVIVGGDIVNRGPQPRECLEIILQRIAANNWKVIKGNHEDYVLQASRGTDHLVEWERLLCAHSAWTAAKIRDYLPDIASWPDNLEWQAPDGSHLSCFHASKKGNRVGMYDSMHDDELLDHAHPVHSALCVGHTHVPFIRQVKEKLIVNAGSVGMPFDRDHRASYALFRWTPEKWTAEIKRIPYDREVTVKAYTTAGYLAEGGPMVPLILEELNLATSRLGVWHRTFEPVVSSGALSLEESVLAMLQSLSKCANILQREL